MLVLGYRIKNDIYRDVSTPVYKLRMAFGDFTNHCFMRNYDCNCILINLCIK